MIQNREKISKNRVEKNWAFFGRKKVVIFRFPWVRTASLGFPGVKKRRKNEFYIQKIIKSSKFYFGPGSPKNGFLRFFRNFFGLGLAWPGPGVVVTWEAVIGSRQPLHVITDFPFYGFF